MPAIAYTDSVQTGDEALARAQAVREARRKFYAVPHPQARVAAVEIPPEPPVEPLPPAAEPLEPPNPVWHPTRVIQRVVAHKYGISISEILGASRLQHITTPRFVGYLLCNELLPKELANTCAIGRRFCRDHSSVYHGILKLKARIYDDPMLRAEYEAIKKVAAEQLAEHARLRAAGMAETFKPIGVVAAQIVERLENNS